jgi:hypothetical protein
MKIGNIITTSTNKFPEEFNILSTIDEITTNLPSLIIGFDMVNKLYPDNDIDNNKLAENLYWTFKKTERRDLHEEGLQNFIKDCYIKLISNIKYQFIDPIQLEKSKIVKIIKFIKKNTIISYQFHDMIYIYCDNYIFGIDLKIIKYIGLNPDKLKHKIEKISSSYLLNEEIIKDYSKYINYIDNKVKFIPYFYYLNSL